MALRADEPVLDFSVEVRRVSEKAILCSFMTETGERGVEQWIPRSQISEVSEIAPGATGGEIGIITISTWIASQKQLA